MADKPDPFETLGSTQQWVREHLQFIDVPELVAADSLDLLHDMAVRLALFFQDTKGAVPGQLWILADDSNHAPLIVRSVWDDPHTNPEDRRMVLTSIQRLVTALDCTRYAFMTEGYAVSREIPKDATEVDLRDIRKQVAKDLQDEPDHYEILFVGSIEKTGAQKVTSYRVTRDPAKGESAPPVKRELEDVGKRPGFMGDLFKMFGRQKTS